MPCQTMEVNIYSLMQPHRLPSSRCLIRLCHLREGHFLGLRLGHLTKVPGSMADDGYHPLLCVHS